MITIQMQQNYQEKQENEFDEQVIPTPIFVGEAGENRCLLWEWQYRTPCGVWITLPKNRFQHIHFEEIEDKLRCILLFENGNVKIFKFVCEEEK